VTVSYTMSVLHKIPALVSALAFGYGIGMAAPDATISSVQSAVVAYNHVGAHRPAARPAEPLPPPPRVNSSGLGGEESRELGKLRDAAQPREGARAASCEFDRPTYTKTPRYESRMDRMVDESDDLDTAGAEALSRLQLPDMRVPITRRTLKYVRFFTRGDRGRGMFETWLKRSGRYQELIESELRQRSLPEDLIWVSMIESGFDPRAKSPAGAVGLWQFMPATGAVYGLVQSRHLDQRKNPRLATKAAVHHLRDLYRRFGAWDLALAAYNMGYEQLLDAIDKYGTADFNELARQEAIPAETAAYVPKIAAAAIVANNLEHFGFDKVEIQRPVDASEIAVPAGTPMKILAKAAGVSTSSLRTLNPDILGDRVPPGRGDYLVMIPPDTVSRARAALPAMLEHEPIVTDESALEAVDLSAGRELRKRRAMNEEDSLLSLLPHPKKRGTLRAPMLEEDEGGEVRARDDDDHERPSFEARDDDGPRLLNKARARKATVLYRVGQGDTLASIARQFGMEAEEVARQAHLDAGDKPKVGSLLKLKVRRSKIDGAVEASGDHDGKEAKDAKAHAPSSKARSRGKHDDADALRPYDKRDKRKKARQGAS
jgi:membrane-bound lytic murein transglycosylase D